MVAIDNLLATLTASQKAYLLDKLKVAVLGDIEKTVKNCPCCDGTNFIKHGSYKGTQKYKCRNTSKIFSYKSHSILSGISDLDKLERLMSMMLDKNFPTVTEIENKLLVTRKTAHSWRTKILTALYKEVDLDNQVLEFDETNFRLSRKGRKGMKYSRKSGKKLVGDNDFNVKVFMSYSRSTGRLELFQSHMGRSSSQNVENYLGLKTGVVIYSDKHRSYKKYFKDRHVLHSTFKSSDHVSKRSKGVHNQTLNYYGGRLQNFLDDGLRGVSTKYLQGYLNWFMFIENCKKDKMSLKDAVMENRVALDIYKQKEKEFQYFLKNNGRNNYGTFKDRYYGQIS